MRKGRNAMTVEVKVFGGPKAIELPEPADVAWKPLAKAVATIGELQEQERDSRERLYALTQERERAAEADRDALGAALRAGDEDPGDVKTQDVEAAIAAETRRAEALTSEAARAVDELVAVMREHGERWAGEQERKVQKCRQAEQVALDAYVSARAERAQAQALHSFVAHFPSRYYVTAPPVLGLSAAHGGPMDFSAIEAALREDAAGTAERPKSGPALGPASGPLQVREGRARAGVGSW